MPQKFELVGKKSSPRLRRYQHVWEIFIICKHFPGKSADLTFTTCRSLLNVVLQKDKVYMLILIIPFFFTIYKYFNLLILLKGNDGESLHSFVK